MAPDMHTGTGQLDGTDMIYCGVCFGILGLW